MPAMVEIRVELDASEAIRYVEECAAEFAMLGRDPTPEEVREIEAEVYRRILPAGLATPPLTITEIDAQLRRMAEAREHRLAQERAECEFCQESVGETNQ